MTFEEAMQKIDGIHPSERLPIAVQRDKEIYRAGLLAAEKISDAQTAKADGEYGYILGCLAASRSIRKAAEEVK